MRLIMITNDDGIGAPGLQRLARAAVNYGEVWIVAPDGQRSAASHSISIIHPFVVYPYDYPVAGVKAFSCTGTAADCVRVGFQNVLTHVPDVMLAGVNHGFNIGADLQYSATVGASFEAVFLGSRAIAFSEDHTSDGAITERYINGILGELIDLEAPDRSIYNVNFPAGRPEDCRGILRDRPVSHFSCFRDWYNVVETLPDGGVRYAVQGEYRSNCEEGTDKCAVFNGYISIGTVKNIS